jgi:hypothetical protein
LLEQIEYREAIQVKSAKLTQGSAPLEVLCSDGEIYFIKTTTLIHPPFPELINELFCNYLSQSFGLAAAVPRLIKLPQIVVDSFISEGNTIDKRYNGIDFDKKIFFGVQNINNATEFEQYNSYLKNKHDFNKFKKPLDLVKIGIFDFWIGNKDRSPKNPNIIISQTKDGFDFNPIDHTAAFGYQSNYKGLKSAQMLIQDSSNILSTSISKSILNFVVSKNNDELNDKIIHLIESSLLEIDFIFQQIPSEWGLSKAGKLKVKEILSDKDRNKIISNSYHRFNIK